MRMIVHGIRFGMARNKIETPAQLRRAIARLSTASPFTDRFTAKWRRMRGTGQRERENVWYTTQHEHWLGWLKYYRGPGAYGRTNWARSADFAYSHIVNPQMLIYLAEAAGIDRKVLNAAARAALKNRETMGSMSAAIRRLIPWHDIETALLRKNLPIGEPTPKRRATTSSRPQPSRRRRHRPGSNSSGRKRSDSGPGPSRPEVALSIRQPWAELILRGKKTVEVRSRNLRVRGPVYLYASHGRVEPADEARVEKLLRKSVESLPRGVVVGVVDLVGCHPLRRSDARKAGFAISGTAGLYAWEVGGKSRWKKPRPPQRHPQPMFFRPF